MSTLLEKALAVPAKNGRTAATNSVLERLDLAVAYIEHRVTGVQLAVAIDKDPKQAGNIYSFIAGALADGLRAGLLVRSNGHKTEEGQ